jgi:hypothetical protein
MLKSLLDSCLEAFSVDDGGSGFVVFLLRYPHLLEGAEAGEDRASDPYGVFALGRRDYLDLHGRGGEGRYFLLHAVSDARVHGCAAREDRVRVEVLTYVHVALHDRVVGRLVDAARLHAQERRLEERLGAPESLVADRYHLFNSIS